MNTINHWSLCSNFGGSLYWENPTENNPTAIQALRIAQEAVILEKLCYLYGRRNSFSLVPNIWDIKLCDNILSNRSHLVTVSNLSVLQIKEDSTASFNEAQFIDPTDVRIDSCDVLFHLKRIPELNRHELSGIDYLLIKDLNFSLEPVWQLKIYHRDQEAELPIGKLTISAKGGEILDLEMNSSLKGC